MTMLPDAVVNFISRQYAGFFAVTFLIAAAGLLWFMAWKRINRPSGRKCHLILFALLCTAASFWLVFEGYFRFLYDRSDRCVILQTHHRWLERNVLLNDLQYRDVKDYRPLRGNDNLVFLLGESIQFGQGVKFEESVTSMLQLRLPQFAFLNISACWWSTSEELNRYARFTEGGYKPKIVILNYSLTDIDEDKKAGWIKSRSGFLKTVGGLRFSYALQFLFAGFAGGGSNGGDNYQNSLLESYKGAEGDRHYQVLRDLLGNIRRSGARILVVVWPLLPIEEHENINEVRVRTLKVLREEGVDSIDVTKLLSALPGRLQVSSRFDRHPGSAVHRLVADYVAEWIEGRPAPQGR